MNNPFSIEDGRLVGPNVFYAPTSYKYYRRPSWAHDRAVVVVLHDTAILAKDRPIVDIDRLLRNASIEYEAQEPLRDALVALGGIPDCVSLTLQNANKARKASWCLCIGLTPTKGGLVNVVQYSPDLRYYGTMHAGPGKLWKWRKRYRGKELRTLDGDLRWDGKEILAPFVIDADGFKQIIYTPNPVGIGIEIMNVGPLGAMRFLRHPSWRKLPRIKIGKRVYHRPSDEQLKTTELVLAALAQRFEIDPALIGRHQDYVPRKIDPEPPFDVAKLRNVLTSER